MCVYIYVYIVYHRYGQELTEELVLAVIDLKVAQLP